MLGSATCSSMLLHMAPQLPGRSLRMPANIESSWAAASAAVGHIMQSAAVLRLLTFVTHTGFGQEVHTTISHA